MNLQDKIKGAILGACLGDVLGVPFEFRTREYISKRNILNHNEEGLHRQSFGTWSDDSSMIFCTMESLIKGYSYKDIGDTFVKWLYNAHWTANKRVFDVGRTTREAIHLIKDKGIYTGLKGEFDCGNGSLMRIIPILFILDKHRAQRFKIIEEVSSLTHSHITCVIGCAIFLEFALNILDGKSKEVAYIDMQNTICDIYDDYPEILNKYQKILFYNIKDISEDLISGNGYVVSTLEAAMFSFFNTSNYIDSIVKGISFGNDTDTVACITGALSGLYYGMESIPKSLLDKIIKLEDIENLTDSFIKSL